MLVKDFAYMQRLALLWLRPSELREMRPDILRITKTANIPARWPTRLQDRIGLRLANSIVVQTASQARLARDATGRDSTVIPNFACMEQVAERPRQPAFLWVGQLVDFKNPLAYARLTRLVPEAEFWMIATDRGAAGNDLAAHVQREVERTPNLSLLPPRPRQDLAELYASVTAVVSTSKFEGFPNVFLEAWAQSTPTLSLAFDPDGVITRHGMGVVANGSLDLLAAVVRSYLEDRREAAAAGARARAYLEDFHDPAFVGDRWAELIHSLLRTPTRG